MRKSYRYFDIVMAAFVTVLLLSNIASAAKLIDLKTSLFGLRLACPRRPIPAPSVRLPMMRS